MNRLADLLEGEQRESAIKQFGEDGTVDALFKSFADTKSKLSSTHRVPEQSASPEEWGSFFNKLGRPESADGYTTPEGLPESMNPIVEALRPAAFESGVTKTQFESLITKAAESTKASEEHLSGLRGAWEAKAKETLGEAAAKGFEAADSLLPSFDEEAQKMIKTVGLDRNPTFIDMALKARDAVTDDGAPKVSAPATPSEVTPEQVRQQIIEIQQSDVYKNQQHPQNAAAKLKFTELSNFLRSKGYAKGVNDSRLQPKMDLDFMKEQ